MPKTELRARKTSPPREISYSSLNLADDGMLIDFCDARWASRDQRRQSMERQWFINIAQYLGHQYHTWSNYSRRLELPQAPSWRVRYVANRLQGVVRKIVSKALRQRPNWVVLPATIDAEDQATARVSTKVLKHYWRTLEMDRVLVELFTWVGCTGSAFIRTYWDPNAGEELLIDPADLAESTVASDKKKAKEGEQFLKEQGFDGRQKGQSQPIRMGDLRVEAISPFELDPDPSVSQWQDVSHVVHTKLRSVEWVKETYGVDVKADPRKETGQVYYEDRIQQLSGPAGFGGIRPASRSDEGTDKVLVHVVMGKPTRRHKRGMFFVVAGEHVLRKGESPYMFTDIPYEMLVEIPVPGRIWGSCALEQAIPIQASYNRGRSQLLEIRNMMGKPKWLVPRGANLGKNAITSEPGEKVEYMPGLKPEMVKPVEVPNYVIELLNQDIRDMEDVTNIHEVSNARVPSGVRSGIAIAQLQEQDDTMLGPTFLVAERALSRIGSYALQILAQNVSEERLVRVVGKDFETEVDVFKGENLMGDAAGPNVNYFDVEVQMGSQLPMSVAARRQLAIELVNSGILNPIDDRERIFEILQLGTEEPTLDARQLDHSQAQRENKQMLDGLMVDVNPWDDDAVHYEALRAFQKQPDYLKYLETLPPEMAQQILQIFEQHALAHSTRMQQMQMQQMQQQAMAEGKVPPAPQQPEAAPVIQEEAVGVDPINQLLQVAQQQGQLL